MAPHTLPSDAYLTVDRRLLPGDDPDVATEEVRAAIGDLSPYASRFQRGVYMWPALVDPEHPGVGRSRPPIARSSGTRRTIVYGQGTFDAGGPCRSGSRP